MAEYGLDTSNQTRPAVREGEQTKIQISKIKNKHKTPKTADIPQAHNYDSRILNANG